MAKLQNITLEDGSITPQMQVIAQKAHELVELLKATGEDAFALDADVLDSLWGDGVKFSLEWDVPTKGWDGDLHIMECIV